MVAKYFPANPSCGDNWNLMAVYRNMRSVSSDDCEDIYFAVHNAEEGAFLHSVCCNIGEEFRALESAVLADYPGCEIIDRDLASIANRPCRDCRHCVEVSGVGMCAMMYGLKINPARTVFCHWKQIREKADAYRAI